MEKLLNKINEVKFYSEDLKADVILVSDVERIITEDHMKNYSDTFGAIKEQLGNINKELNNLTEDND
tara:strand:- start:393 stop:593 length:201 start_codon:yes stop_codon:yes gene_type:complete